MGDRAGKLSGSAVRRRLAASALALTLLSPGVAFAAPQERETSFNDISCPADQNDIDEPPSGRLSYDVLGINAAHQFSTGKGIRIGLLDSGVNPNHATLQGATIEGGADFTDSDGATTDHFGSGTTYASYLVGSSEGLYPVRGIAPDATIVPIKIMDRVPENMSGEYLEQTAGRLAEGINWAIDNDLDLVVTALALPRGYDHLTQAVERAQQEGLLIIAPAGELTSDDDEPETEADMARYPASYNSVLSVTAVNPDGSSVDSMLRTQSLDIAAPGGNVPGASNANNNMFCVVSKQGSSSLNAAINTAGVAALVMSAHPGESADMIVHRLQITAVRPTASLYNSATGWGIIDSSGAINFVDDGTAHGPLSPNFGEQIVPEFVGQDVPDVVPDPQRMTKPLTWVGLAAGAAIALALLLVAAGRWRKQTGEEKKQDKS